MATYVLVHGAFRGGWYWGPVRTLLQQAGHHVLAPSLTGMGDRIHLRDQPVTRDTWVTDIVNLLEYEDVRNVVPVGHSLGGVITSEVSGFSSARIGVLGFLDAPVLEPGESPADLYDPPSAATTPAATTPTTTDPSRWSPPLPVNESEITDAATADWMRARLTPTPAAPGIGPLRIADPAALQIPRRIAFCSRTPEMFPAARSRARFDAAGRAYDLLDAGHDAPVSAPDLVVGWMRSLVN